MRNALNLILSLMASFWPCVSSAVSGCDYHDVTKYDFIFFYKASKLEYRPASKNRDVFADIASDISSIEKSLYRFIKPSQYPSGIEIGFINVPNKGEFMLFEAEEKVRALRFKAQTERDNNIKHNRKHEFENAELYDFLLRTSDNGEKYYYFSAKKEI